MWSTTGERFWLRAALATPSTPFTCTTASRCGMYRPVNKSHASCVRPSDRLFRTKRTTELTPSLSAPLIVRRPVRVKSVFRAPVPEYNTDSASALSAQRPLNAASKPGKLEVSTDVPAARVAAHAPGTASRAARRAKRDCTTFVRSRLSMQLVRTTPCWMRMTRPLEPRA